MTTDSNINNDIVETISNPIFNTVDELQEYLNNCGYEDTVFLKNPSFVKAITGISSSGQLIYDYNLMIPAAMEEENWNFEDATEWIEYNTIRSIPYMGDFQPIISFPIEW